MEPPTGTDEKNLRENLLLIVKGLGKGKDSRTKKLMIMIALL